MTTFLKKESYFDNSTKPDKTAWTALVARYQTPSLWKSIGQAVNTFLPFFWVMVFNGSQPEL